MESPTEKPSLWIRLYRSGLSIEVTIWLVLAAVGVGVGMLLGFQHLVPLAILSFGFPWVFWRTVTKLAIEDGMEDPFRLDD